MSQPKTLREQYEAETGKSVYVNCTVPFFSREYVEWLEAKIVKKRKSKKVKA